MINNYKIYKIINFPLCLFIVVISLMLQQKITKKLNSAFLRKFPKEIVSIIAGYACFQDYELKDLEKFEEARKFGRSFSNRYITDGDTAGEIKQRVNSGMAMPIFTSIFTLSDLGSGKVLEQIDRYKSACESLLNTNFLSCPTYPTCLKSNVEIILYKKVRVIQLFKNQESSESSDSSEPEVWDRCKTISSCNESLTWSNLFNIIYSCQTSDNFQEKISSIHFDYQHSKFIVSIKIRF